MFGTVVDWRSGVAREVAAFLARHGVVNLDPAEFADAWPPPLFPSDRRSKKRSATLHGAGCLAPGESGRDIDGIWRRPHKHALCGVGRAQSGLASIGSVARFYRGPTTPESAIYHCDTLERQCPPDAQYGQADRTSLGRDLGAEVVRAYKPLPEAYLRTAGILAMLPEEVCLVAAHNCDLAAARKCGLRTAFIVRPIEHGPGQTSDLYPSAGGK